MALCLHQLPAADIQSDLTPHGPALVAADVADMRRKTATLKAATQVVRGDRTSTINLSLWKDALDVNDKSTTQTGKNGVHFIFFNSFLFLDLLY